MIDLHFYDREGNPIPGKAPTALHVVSGVGGPATISRSAADACFRAFDQFAQAYRLGLYESLTQRVVIDRYTTLMLQVNQGVFSAIATVLPQADGEYYGGIVAQIQEIIDPDGPDPSAPRWWDNMHYDYGGSWLSRPRGADAYPDPAIRRLIPDSVAVNAACPVVPGPLGENDAPTDTLIFQIARSGDLTKRPVAAGVVKIFRIRSPYVGHITSHNYKGVDRYLVSANYEVEADPPYRTRLDAFYLGGQVLPIPPTPWQDNNYNRDSVRLYTIGFGPPTFALAGLAGGVVLVVYEGKVLAYHTSFPGEGWKVVIDDPYAGSRAYGYDFAEEVATTVSEVQTTITCSGTDDGGALSGFEIKVTENPAGSSPPVYSATLILAPDATPAGPTTQRTFTQSATWTNTVTTPIDKYNALFDDGGADVQLGGLKQSWTNTLSEFLRAPAGGATDDFVGGVLNPVSPRALSYSSASSYDEDTFATYTYQIYCAGSPLGWVPGAEQYGLYAPTFQATDRERMYLESGRFGVIAWEFTRDQLYTASITAASCPLGFPAPASIAYTPSPTAPEDPVLNTSGQVTPDASVRYSYTAMDGHRKKLAWRYDKQWTGTWAADLLSEAPFTPLTTATVSMNPAQFNMKLLRRGIDPVTQQRIEAYVIPDFLNGFFGTTVKWAEAYTTSCVALGYTKIDWAGQWYFNRVDRPNSGLSTGTTDVAQENFFLALKWFDVFPSDALPEFTGTNPWEQYDGAFAASVTVSTPNPVYYSPADVVALGDVVFTDLSGDPIAATSPPVWPSDTDGLIYLQSCHWTQALFDAGAYSLTDREIPIFSIDDRIYVDPRTDGYIAQVFWEAQEDGVNAYSHPKPRVMIGNDDGVVPIEDVLNEWWAIVNSESSASSGPYNRVFIRRESAKDTSLI